MRTHSRLGVFIAGGMVAMALVLASCSTSQTLPPASGTSATSSKTYGSLNVALDMGAGGLDPQIASGGGYAKGGAALFDTLGMRDPKTEREIPLIAERWEISPDGMAHTFYIRKGVKFHDGSDLTGVDVKYSIERNMAPESLTSFAGLWRAAIAKVELQDNYTVVLRMKTPQYALLRGGTSGSQTAIVPKKYIEEKGVEEFRKTLVGSGPWKLVGYEPQNYMKLEADENNWRQVVPQFKNITVRYVKEEGSKVAMLKTGELDIAEIAPDSVSGIRAAGLRVVVGKPIMMYFGVVLLDQAHSERYAFGDVRVRKALQLAINQKELGEDLFYGDGKPYLIYNFSPQNWDYFDPNTMKPDPYDPEQSKRLLAEAGHPKGLDTRLYDVGEGGLLSIVNLAVAGYLRKVGVNAEIIALNYSAFYSKLMPKQSPEIWPSIWGYRGSGGVSAQGIEGLRSAFHGTNSFTKNNTNRRLDEVIDLWPLTGDPAERKPLEIEMMKLALEGYTMLEFVEVPQYWVASPKVGEWKAVREDLDAQSLASITHPK